MEVTQDRRRHVRWAVREWTAGRIAGIDEVSLINISLGGALIEHSHPLRPGTVFFLTLLVPRQKVYLTCRAIRSALYRSEVQTDGERHVIRRTGVEFQAHSEDSRRLISEYVNSLRGEN